MNSGVLFAIAAACLWGFVYYIDQLVLSKTSAAGVFFVDVILTAAIVLPLAWFRRSDIDQVLSSGPSVLLLILCSLLATALASYCILAGIKSVGASLASTIEIGYPCVVVILASLALREMPKPQVLAGILMVVAGSAIVVYASESSQTIPSDQTSTNAHVSVVEAGAD